MFESIIALTSSTTRRVGSVKFLKTFASFNWNSVEIEINCRPRKKCNGSFSIQYKDFNIPPKKMVHCKKTPLESIKIQGILNNSTVELSCIFDEGTSHWFEAKIAGENKNVINIIEAQLMNIFKETGNTSQKI